jgi:hypothetical protein
MGLRSNSAHSLLARVFTQPGPKADILIGWAVTAALTDYALRHPSTRNDRTALIAASETANDAAAVQTVLIVLGEIPPSKLLEIFH